MVTEVFTEKILTRRKFFKNAAGMGGGVTGYLKIAHLAEAHNLPVTTHGIHDIHVHLLAAVPNSSYLEVHGFGLEPYLAHPLQIDNGEALAPDRPGHGVELNWKALEAYRGAP